MADQITNSQDIIDSRDIIERIEELTVRQADANDTDNAEDKASLALTEDEADELKSLQALAEDAEGYADDWKYGVALIRDSYFKTYAEEFADDIGAINASATWPNNCIDWDRAARELQMDYTQVTFDGVDYWVR